MTKQILILFLITFLFLTKSIAIELNKNKNSSVNFHGYFRDGFGVSDQGDKQTSFGLPFAAAKYRLGNENDTDVELAVDYRYYVNGINNNKHVQLYFMMDGYATYENDFKLERIPQIYASFNNIIADGINVWIGRRYYDRKDIHMNDHFWLNTAQNADKGAAAGIEGVVLSGVKLKFAVIQGIDNQADNTMTLFYDLRVSDIPLNESGKLTLWGIYAKRYAPEDTSVPLLLALENKNGYGFGGWYDLKIGNTITNTTAVLYRYGAAVPSHDFNHNPLINDPSIQDVNYLEINNNFLYEGMKNLSMQWASVYRITEQTQTTKGTYDINWYSTGVRPIYYLSQYMNLATEVGYDYIDNKSSQQKGSLFKGTVALELTLEKGYYKRPVLRLFQTVAKWDNDFKGDVGGTAYMNSTKGYSTGAQVEWWW